MNSPAPVLRRTELAELLEFTLLAPDTTAARVREFLAEAQDLGVGAVCLSPNMLAAAADTDLKLVTVAGFPSGKHHSLIKAAEARLAVQYGASEVDMVADLGYVTSGNLTALQSEILTVREAIPHPVGLKVILETALLNPAQIQAAATAAAQAGADFVKTSTGFHPAGGASVAAVTALRAAVGPKIGVKASGGIRSYEQACELIAAGANRLGISAAAQILAGAPE